MSHGVGRSSFTSRREDLWLAHLYSAPDQPVSLRAKSSYWDVIAIVSWVMESSAPAADVSLSCDRIDTRLEKAGGPSPHGLKNAGSLSALIRVSTISAAP